jgi:Domain of unknown function (DUF1772)
MLTVLNQIVTIFAVLATAVVYGTDMCAVLVMKPAYARLDDATVTKVAGWGHLYGDKRMPVPGAGGVVCSILATVLAILSGRLPSAIASAVAVAALLAWLVIYVRVAKPINTLQTAAAQSGDIPENARELQTEWESVLGARVVLQGSAVAALCAALAL